MLSYLDQDIQGHLLYVLPLIFLGAIGVSWLLIGRTLRPVERIRAEAAEITGSDLHRRIPESGSDDEIGRLTHTLNGMLDRLEASADRQRRFVADASHELRTPLAAVRTSMEVGLAHPDRAPGPNWPPAPSPRPPGCNASSKHSCCWPAPTTTPCCATVNRSTSQPSPVPRSAPHRPVSPSNSVQPGRYMSPATPTN
ncbi:HAMP domain-containing protein [Streptomyces sp. S1D4-11]